MAQRRMLSRRISQSKKVNALSLKSQLIWTWTHPFLDDYGRYTADPEDIKTEVFPKNAKISIKDINNALLECLERGLITLYRVEGKEYQVYTKFEDHQTFRADRPRQAEYPKPEDGIPMATNDTPKLSEVKLSKDKISKEYIKYKYKDFVLLTRIEHKKLLETYENSVVKQYIDRLNNYIGSKGKKYKSHYHTLLTWMNKDVVRKKVRFKPEEMKPDPVMRKKVGELISKTSKEMK